MHFSSQPTKSTLVSRFSPMHLEREGSLHCWLWWWEIAPTVLQGAGAGGGQGQPLAHRSGEQMGKAIRISRSNCSSWLFSPISLFGGEARGHKVERGLPNYFNSPQNHFQKQTFDWRRRIGCCCEPHHLATPNVRVQPPKRAPLSLSFCPSRRPL